MTHSTITFVFFFFSLSDFFFLLHSVSLDFTFF